MRWPFGRKQINGPDNAGFDDSFMGVAYRSIHEGKAQPSPGAQAYAWETLGLPAFTPIGAGNHAMSKRPRPFSASAPLFTQQGARTIGVPLTAGQFILQPLLIPEGGQA